MDAAARRPASNTPPRDAEVVRIPPISFEEVQKTLNGLAGKDAQEFLQLMEEEAGRKEEIVAGLAAHPDVLKQFGGDEAKLREAVESLANYLREANNAARANQEYLARLDLSPGAGEAAPERQSAGRWALDKLKSVLSYPVRHPVKTALLLLIAAAVAGGAWWYLTGGLPVMYEHMSQAWEWLGTRYAGLRDALFRSTGPVVGGTPGAEGLTKIPSAPGPPPAEMPYIAPDYSGGGIMEGAREIGDKAVEGLRSPQAPIDPRMFGSPPQQ